MNLKKMAESNLEKISVMGTMHEIGFFEGGINENTPCNPINNYGIAKNSLRQLTKQLCINNKKDFQWLRGFYIVGNTKYGSSIFSKISNADEKGDKFFPFRSGKNQYDFLDYDVFCKYVAITVCQNEILGIINICSVSLNDCLIE